MEESVILLGDLGAISLSTIVNNITTPQLLSKDKLAMTQCHKLGIGNASVWLPQASRKAECPREIADEPFPSKLKGI